MRTKVAVRNKPNPSKVDYIRCRSWPVNMKSLPWTHFSVLAIWNNFSAFLSASEMSVSSLQSCLNLRSWECGNILIKDFGFTMPLFLYIASYKALTLYLERRMNTRQDVEMKSASCLKKVLLQFKILLLQILTCDFFFTTFRGTHVLVKIFRDISCRCIHRTYKSALV